MFERYRDLFDYCPPKAWPWLWLQLAYLLACKALDGRERLLMVMPNGKVHVLGLGDDPAKPTPWRPDDIRQYARPMDRLLASQSANTRENGYPWTDLCPWMVGLSVVPGHPPPRVSSKFSCRAGFTPPLWYRHAAGQGPPYRSNPPGLTEYKQP